LDITDNAIDAQLHTSRFWADGYCLQLCMSYKAAYSVNCLVRVKLEYQMVHYISSEMLYQTHLTFELY